MKYLLVLENNLNLNYLNYKSSKNNCAKDEVIKDALENIPLAVDLASIDFVEDLHHHKGVEDDGVVF